MSVKTSPETMVLVAGLNQFLLERISLAGLSPTVSIRISDLSKLLVELNQQTCKDNEVINADLDYQKMYDFAQAKNKIIYCRVQQVLEDFQGCQCNQCADALKYLTEPLIEPFEPSKTLPQNRH